MMKIKGFRERGIVQLRLGLKPQRIGGEISFTGIPVSSGIALGKALVFLPWEKGKTIEKYAITKSQIEKEIARLKSAASKAEDYYSKLTASGEVSKAAKEILEVHKILIKEIVEEVETKVRKQLFNAEHILEDVINSKITFFEQQRQNAHFVYDLKDIGRVLLEFLMGKKRERNHVEQEVILVTSEILPSDMAELMCAKVKFLGLITETGGPTSHAAIIARQMGIPAVSGIEGATKIIKDDSELIVDGRSGTVFLNPSLEKVEKYKTVKADYELYIQKLIGEVKGKRAETKDGYCLQLGINIMHPSEVFAAKEIGFDSVGLFRTEGLLFRSNRLLTEEEQIEIYKQLAGIPTKIRTFDVGGDKIPTIKDRDFSLAEEKNSFLGLRGIRLYMHNDFWKDIFVSQVRAILQASAENKDISVMFPMVTRLYEFRWAKEIVKEQQNLLKERKISFNPHINIGVMVEVPSLLAVADELAGEADYFSLGSNDLIQYILATDRRNASVAYLYDPFHYSIIWSIKQFIEAAHKKNKPIYLCGDMGADPIAVLLLVGLGIDGISIPTWEVPKIKYVLQGLEKRKSEEFVERLLSDKKLLTEDSKEKTIREKILSQIKLFFNLDLIERISLVSGKLSSKISI